MMRVSGFLQSRTYLSKKLIFGKTAEIHDALWLPALTSQANISTARQNFPASADAPDRVYVDYTIYKGKASLSVSPVLPTFTKMDLGRGLRVDRRGCMMLSFAPAVGERKYDWEKKQLFSLSATEVGSLISLGPSDSCEFFHDPSMKSSNAGQVRKSLSINPQADCTGYFISLNVVNNILKTNERFTVPVTTGEFAVMRSAFNFALPHIMGWGQLTSKLPRITGENQLNVVNIKAKPEIVYSEWER